MLDAQLLLELKAEMDRSRKENGLAYYEIDAQVLDRVYCAAVEALEEATSTVPAPKMTKSQTKLLIDLFETGTPETPWVEINRNELRVAKGLEKKGYLELRNEEAKLTPMGLDKAKSLTFRI